MQWEGADEKGWGATGKRWLERFMKWEGDEDDHERDG